MNYKLYNENLAIDDDFEEYNKLHVPFFKIALNVCDVFDDEYKKFNSLDSFLNECDSLIYELLTYPLEYSMDLLASEKIYTIDEKTFANIYIDKILAPWNAALDEIYSANEQIDMHSKSAADYRALRKDSRSKFIGGGFGFKGAIEGITTASILNAGTGLIHGGINAIGNAMDAVHDANKKNSIFKSDETLNNLSDALCDSIILFADAVAEILNIKYDFNVEEIKSTNIYNNLSRIPSNEQVHYLLDALSLYPYNTNIYLYLVRNYGDNDKSLSAFGNHFGIYLIDTYKEVLLNEIIKSSQCKTTSEMDKLSVKLREKMRFLGVSSSTVYDTFLTNLNNLKNAQKSVDGIVFNSISDAEQAKKVKDKFDKEIDNLDKISMQSLSDLMSTYKTFNPKLKALLKSQYEKINETYTKLDIEQRTFNGVVYESIEAKNQEMEKPKRTYNGVVYDTIEEKDIAVEKLNRTFNGVVYNTIEEKDIAADKYYKQQEAEQAIKGKNIIEEINTLVSKQNINFLSTDKATYDECKKLLDIIKSKYKTIPKCEICNRIQITIKNYEVSHLNDEIDYLVKTSKINFNKISDSNYEKCKNIIKTVKSQSNYMPSCNNYNNMVSLVHQYEKQEKEKRCKNKEKEENSKKRNHSLSVIIKSLFSAAILVALAVLAYYKIHNKILKWIVIIFLSSGVLGSFIHDDD